MGPSTPHSWNKRSLFFSPGTSANQSTLFSYLFLLAGYTAGVPFLFSSSFFFFDSSLFPFQAHTHTWYYLLRLILLQFSFSARFYTDWKIITRLQYIEIVWRQHEGPGPIIRLLLLLLPTTHLFLYSFPSSYFMNLFFSVTCKTLEFIDQFFLSSSSFLFSSFFF